MSGQWWLNAACRGVPTELFFPIGTKTTREHCGEALSYCDGCKVRAVCLEDALRHYGPGRREYGVRGGTTEDERDLILTQRRAAATAEAAAG